MRGSQVRLHRRWWSATLLLALVASIASPVSRSAFAQAAALPDLIVTGIQYEPAQPRVGDIVKFSVTVKNQGEGATPEGTVIGGVFFLDDTPIAITDKYKTSLPVGASVTIPATGAGAFGDGTWLARPGTYMVGFLVDDVNRIPESNDGNNSYTNPTPLVIKEEFGPDLVVSDVTWSPREIKPGHKLTFSATATNVGNRPTAAGTPVVAQFSIGNQPIAKSAPYAAAIQPGQSVKLTADLGPNGSGKGDWRPDKGSYTVQAIVDPANKVSEIRDDNNTRTITFVVGQEITKTAKPSDSFVASIGVATHVQYYDTTYGKYEEIFKSRLIESGIRYIRDGTDLSNTEAISRFIDLAKSGVRSLQIMDPKITSPEQAPELAKALAPSIFAVEGPNEPNIFNPNLFPDQIRAYQQQMYSAIKADPATKHLPVLSPALAYGSEDSKELGPVACDIAGIHPYQGGQLPDVALADNFVAANDVCPGKPIWATETGYNTAVNTIFGQPGISDAATAKYMPRLYLDFFNRGIQHTFAYEFLDEHPQPELTDPEQHFGMVRYDGTPKPSFIAIKNLIHLLQDPDTQFAPGSLSYTLSGNTTDLRSLLLQKGDGTYYLVLWLNARSYDLGTKQDVKVPTQSVTLTFDRPVRSATSYLPGNTNQATRLNPGKTLTLDVPDEPLVVQLTSVR
jgi:hypothetical protein